MWDTCRLGLGTLVREITTCGREITESELLTRLPGDESFLAVSNEEPVAQLQTWIFSKKVSISEAGQGDP